MDDELKIRFKKCGLEEFISKFEQQDLLSIDLVESVEEKDFETLGLLTIGKKIAFRKEFLGKNLTPPSSLSLGTLFVITLLALIVSFLDECTFVI